jgi:DNA-binding LacI/PurR family transcriptional regulator
LNTTDLFDANILKARKFNNQKTNQITFLKETILNIFMRDFYENIEKEIEENK